MLMGDATGFAAGFVVITSGTGPPVDVIFSVPLLDASVFESPK